MREYFAWLAGTVLALVVLFVVGLAFNLIDLRFLGWRTDAETHITRQTNGYLTAHQQALREMMGQYDDLGRQLAETADADTGDALRAQQRGVVRQMREEADLIPRDVQPDIAAFLSSH